MSLSVALNAHPDHAIAPSLAAGLALVRFLFESQFLFALFLGLQALLDGLDGSLARATDRFSRLGRAFDRLSDNALAIFLFAKSYLHLKDTTALVALLLHVLHMTLAGRSWNTVVGPSIRLAKLFSVLKQYRLGLILQCMYVPLALVVSHILAGHEGLNRAITRSHGMSTEERLVRQSNQTLQHRRRTGSNHV